jgi:hypothetical protein
VAAAAAAFGGSGRHVFGKKSETPLYAWGGIHATVGFRLTTPKLVPETHIFKPLLHHRPGAPNANLDGERDRKRKKERASKKEMKTSVEQKEAQIGEKPIPQATTIHRASSQMMGRMKLSATKQSARRGNFPSRGTTPTPDMLISSHIRNIPIPN